jgi:N-acetylneuraminic acid mutarotase
MKKNPLLILAMFTVTCAFAQGQWEEKALLPEHPQRSGAISFSLNEFGYLGLGHCNDHGNLGDLWRYDPRHNSWEQKASLPAAFRNGALSFVVNGKAYVGLGYSAGYLKELWEYDPTLDSWIRKADFPGAVVASQGFGIGNKGYLVCGMKADGSDSKEVWSYAPASNEWTQLNNFPGVARSEAAAMAIKQKGFLVTGYSAGGLLNEFWEYDPLLDNWSVKPSAPFSVLDATAISIGNQLYLCGGRTLENTYNQQVAKYDHDAGTWQVLGGTLSPIGMAPTAFGFRDRGYFSSGIYGAMDPQTFNPVFKQYTMICDAPEVTIEGAFSSV